MPDSFNDYKANIDQPSPIEDLGKRQQKFDDENLSKACIVSLVIIIAFTIKAIIGLISSKTNASNIGLSCFHLVLCILQLLSFIICVIGDKRQVKILLGLQSL